MMFIKDEILKIKLLEYVFTLQLIIYQASCEIT